MRRIGTFIVFAVWIVLLVMLVRREAPSDNTMLLPLADEGRVANRTSEDSWFSVYQGDRKIGWSHRTVTRGADATIFRDESDLRLAMLGTEQPIQTSLTARTDSNDNLESFRFRLLSPAATFSAEGEIENNRLRVSHGTGDRRDEFELALDEPIHLPTTLRSQLDLWGAKAGDRYRTEVLSPFTMKREGVEILINGRETIQGPNGPVETVHITQTQQGISANSWIAQDGQTIREEASLGFRLQRSSPADALARADGNAPVDLALESRIPWPGTIENPRESEHLRLALGGSAANKIPHDPPRQRVREGVLEIEREPTAGAPFNAEPPGEEFSRPSPFIESDAAEIVAQAKLIVGDETDPARKATKLVEWVHREMTQAPSVTLPSARAVLASRRGDCNEHAVLLAALARAAGIPARVVAGAVYANDGFYYHAWDELWLGRWVSADAIFGQMPADATHIKILEGGPERHLELVEIVGQLEFKKIGNPS